MGVCQACVCCEDKRSLTDQIDCDKFTTPPAGYVTINKNSLSGSGNMSLTQSDSSWLKKGIKECIVEG